MLDQVTPELLLQVCGEDPSFICREVLERTDSERWAELSDIVFAKPLTIGIVLLTALVVSRLVQRVIHRFEQTVAGEHPPSRRLKRRLRRTAIGQRLPEGVLATGSYSLRAAARARTIGVVLRSIAAFAIWSIAAVTVLGELGINLGPLVASAGIAGLAIGFGAQSLVRDFLAGMFILVEDQYGVGDTLDAGDLAGSPVVGTVEAVSLRTTRLRGPDGTVWHVPNGQIVRVGNKSQQWGRAVLDVVVGPAADVELAQEVVKATADALAEDTGWSGRILGTPELMGVEAIAPEGVTIQIVLQTLPDARLPVLRELRARVKRALDDAEIPPPLLPQLGVAATPAPAKATKAAKAAKAAKDGKGDSTPTPSTRS